MPQEAREILDMAPNSTVGICVVGSHTQYYVYSKPSRGPLGACRSIVQEVSRSAPSSGKRLWEFSRTGRERTEALTVHSAEGGERCPDPGADSYVSTQGVSEGVFVAIWRSWQESTASDVSFKDLMASIPAEARSSAPVRSLEATFSERPTRQGDTRVVGIEFDPGDESTAAHYVLNVKSSEHKTWAIAVDIRAGEVRALSVDDVVE